MFHSWIFCFIFAQDLKTTYMKKEKLTFVKKIELMNDYVTNYEIGITSTFQFLTEVYKLGWKTKEEVSYINSVMDNSITLDTKLFKKF